MQELLTADPSILGTAIAAIIFGLVYAAKALARNKLIDFSPDDSDDDRLARIEKLLEQVAAGCGKSAPPRLTASERAKRDRAIQAMAKANFEAGDIARLLNCTERVTKRVLAERGTA